MSWIIDKVVNHPVKQKRNDGSYIRVVFVQALCWLGRELSCSLLMTDGMHFSEMMKTVKPNAAHLRAAFRLALNKSGQMPFKALYGRNHIHFHPFTAV